MGIPNGCIKNNLIGTRQHVESHQNIVRLSYNINSRQNTNQMLAQMSADMWQVAKPDEEIAVEAARRRAKEEDERAREEQARREEEAEQAASEAEAIKQHTEAAKAKAERNALEASSHALQSPTRSAKFQEMWRHGQANVARRKDLEAAALEQLQAQKLERLRAKAQDEAMAKARLEDMEDELRSAEDHH